MKKKTSLHTILFVVLLTTFAVFVYYNGRITFPNYTLKKEPQEPVKKAYKPSTAVSAEITHSAGLVSEQKKTTETATSILQIPPKKPEKTQAEKAHEWLVAMEKCHGIHKIKTNEKVVALTFDDGPNGKYTQEILEILKQHHIRGTFFLIGKNALQYPKLVQELFAEQNVLGNHTYSHNRFSKLSVSEATEELQKDSSIIYELTGVVPALFRPPYGICSDDSRDVTKKLAYKTILWNDITDDYDINKTTAEVIASDILKLVHPGGILALHDGGGDRSKSVAALKIIISTLEKEGYKFLTVPELLDVSPYQIVVMDNYVSWGHQTIKKHENPSDARPINTIIIHSAYSHLDNDKYDLDALLKEHAVNNFAPHYIIERDGIIHRLVPDSTIAYHAGKSKMPDGRTNINDFSIGIELLNAETDSPTTAQYRALNHLVSFLKSVYPIEHILGNNQVSGENKLDPWNFEWSNLTL